jgi:hypothetical protein
MGDSSLELEGQRHRFGSDQARRDIGANPGGAAEIGATAEAAPRTSSAQAQT